MGTCANYLCKDTPLLISDSNNNLDIQEFFLIQPELLPSEFGIKRRALKKPSLNEVFTITSLYKKVEDDLRLVQHEAMILKNLSHPNIIKFEAIFEDSIVYHVVTEELAGTTLIDLLLEKQKLNETTTKKIIKQILKALEYLHGKSICYGNLCMDSIILQDNKIKLFDFTKARFIDEKSDSTVGNYNFMPPEGFAESFNEKSDMWSVGVITYYLLKGILPFEGKEKVEIIENISKARYSTSGMSDDAKKFISKLILINPENRFTAKKALDDSWITVSLELN
jgi:serine/threonine protein kinase